ncbi:hypothetical protein [Nocardia speluncae]|nr:hypothetical protein [Nocardia speluncae]
MRVRRLLPYTVADARVGELIGPTRALATAHMDPSAGDDAPAYS